MAMKRSLVSRELSKIAASIRTRSAGIAHESLSSHIVSADAGHGIQPYPLSRTSEACTLCKAT